jgi:3-methylcrotonyl-CoA carboxylase alpha subunit
MEAMKMEHTVCAPCRGVVKRLHFVPGDQVADGAELIEFEPIEEAR